MTGTVLVNGERRALAAGTTVTAVVAELAGGSPPTGIAVALNDTVLPRARWDATVLAGGDRVEILTAVQGG